MPRFDEGGDIPLGVDDQGRPVGVEPGFTARLCADIADATNDPNRFDPPFLLQPEPLVFEGLSLIAVQVPESSRDHRCIFPIGFVP